MEIPEDSLIAIGVSPASAADELRLAAAIKLFEIGRLSSGAAARLAGVPKTVFLSKLADFGVDTFRLLGDDLRRETPLG